MIYRFNTVQGEQWLKWIRQISLAIVIGWVVASTAVAASDDVVAEGDGFVITRNDIAAEQTYCSERGFETTQKEYVNGAVKIWLFSKEAVAKGLVGEVDPSLDGVDKIERLHRLEKLYVNYLLESYPLSDQAIESYYYAYPEKFGIGIKDSITGERNLDAGELDQAKKDWIRRKILSTKEMPMSENELQRLKDKYHVRLTGII